MVVLVLATGTLADQITRNFTKDPLVVFAAWVFLAALAELVWFLKLRDGSGFAKPYIESLAPKAQKYLTIVGIGLSGFAGFLVTMSRGNTANLVASLVCLLIIFGAVSYFLFQNRFIATSFNSQATDRWISRNDNVVLLACMAVGAAFTSITYRPNTDDHYYVNMSTYIFEKSVIPVRDTVLSDQVFNGYPRGSSWEVLWGVLGSAIGVHPTTMLYLFVAPIASALGILALANLISTTGIKRYSIALITVTTFLIFDGANGYTFGAYQGPRAWQGKSFFLALLLPLIFMWILEVLRKSSLRNSFALFGIVVASLGATTTTFIVVIPLLAVAFIVAAIYQKRDALISFGLTGTYLVVAALLFKDARSGDSVQAFSAHGMGISLQGISHSAATVMPSTFQLVTGMAKPSWHAALFALAMVWGWLALRNQYSRGLIALSAATWAVISLPGIHEAFFKLTGSTAIGWRYFWLVPIPLLVGATGSYIYESIAASKRFKNLAFPGAMAFVAMLAVLPMTLGSPPWKPLLLIDAELAKPTLLKVGYGFNEAYQAIQDIGEKGDIVLARNGVSASLAAMTTDFYTVAPRDTYARFALRGFKNGFVKERIKLATYIVGDEVVTYKAGEMIAALEKIQVNIVCLPNDREPDIALFQSLGYTDKESTVKKKGNQSWYWCGRTNKFD